jgi:hypothetical protein
MKASLDDNTQTPTHLSSLVRQTNSLVRERSFDDRLTLFGRSARCCVSNSRLGRDHIKARLVIRQSSTPARGTVVPVNDEYNVIASDNERVQR